tara:strand:+ start:187 stop:915 length:729 start_codon:yes stop_codon:yes gene_type:complete
LSGPIFLIYLIFCFSYLINTDNTHYQQKKVLSDGYIDSIENEPKQTKIIAPTNIDSPTQKIEKINVTDNNAKIKKSIPKPIVSYTPKPIIIDSNIIIQNEKELIKNDNSNIEKPIIKKENNKEILSEKNVLTLNEIMICRGIYKRNPIKPGFNFINNVDSLFCYTKISNSGPKQEIKHVWFFENKEISSVRYNIKTSYNYRSWSRKTINPNQTGDWRVDVIDSRGNILGTRNFSIESISNTY